MVQDVEASMGSSKRSLQQLAGGGNSSAIEVTTAKQFLTAVATGAEDIRVTDHMDLTGLLGEAVLEQNLITTWKLRSVRVRSIPCASTRMQPFQSTEITHNWLNATWYLEG